MLHTTRDDHAVGVVVGLVGLMDGFGEECGLTDEFERI
jgi:hypothetical protein